MNKNDSNFKIINQPQGLDSPFLKSNLKIIYDLNDSRLKPITAHLWET
jgi:hypothetical protein